MSGKPRRGGRQRGFCDRSYCADLKDEKVKQKNNNDILYEKKKKKNRGVGWRCQKIKAKACNGKK